MFKSFFLSLVTAIVISASAQAQQSQPFIDQADLFHSRGYQMGFYLKVPFGKGAKTPQARFGLRMTTTSPFRQVSYDASKHAYTVSSQQIPVMDLAFRGRQFNTLSLMGQPVIYSTVGRLSLEQNQKTIFEDPKYVLGMLGIAVGVVAIAHITCHDCVND